MMSNAIIQIIIAVIGTDLNSLFYNNKIYFQMNQLSNS